MVVVDSGGWDKSRGGKEKCHQNSTVRILRYVVLYCYALSIDVLMPCAHREDTINDGQAIQPIVLFNLDA